MKRTRIINGGELENHSLSVCKRPGKRNKIGSMTIAVLDETRQIEKDFKKSN